MSFYLPFACAAYVLFQTTAMRFMFGISTPKRNFQHPRSS